MILCTRYTCEEKLKLPKYKVRTKQFLLRQKQVQQFRLTVVHMGNIDRGGGGLEHTYTMFALMLMLKTSHV